MAEPGTLTQTVSEIQRLLDSVDGKQNSALAATVVLSAANWNELSQTISCGGVTEENIVFVAPLPAFCEAYGKSGIICAAQGAGSLVFSAASLPETDISVGVVIL
ncbi:MAG: hypothetical protein IJC39_02440 [Firmicutes bacterium]|nr:hypothetical protein [Bacillota bacterium]